MCFSAYRKISFPISFTATQPAHLQYIAQYNVII